MPTLGDPELYRPVVPGADELERTILVAERLPALVAEQAMSQRQLAIYSGCTLRTVYDACHGRPVSLRTLLRLADGLGVPLHRLSPFAAELLAGVV